MATSWSRTITGQSPTVTSNSLPTNFTFPGPRPWIDVRDPLYGAVGNGSTNDTAAINAAISAARPSAATVYLPPGQYLVDELNFTNCQGVILRGAGINVTRINPNSASRSVIDMSGSQYCGIEDLQIGFFNQTPNPTVGILMSAATGAGTFAVTANHFKNIYVSGKYVIATLYSYGGGDINLHHSQFYNYRTSGTPSVVELTYTNVGSVSSDLVTTAAGSQATSDWTFTGCELHDFSGIGAGLGLLLDGASQVRFFGGVISNSANGNNYIGLSTTASTHLLFHGTTIYSDTGPIPLNVFTISSAINCQDISLIGCVTQASGAVFRGNAGSTYDKLLFFGKVTATNVIGDGTAITVTDPLVFCDGAQVNIGTGTITRGILINPGTITATTNTSVAIASSGQLQTGSAMQTGTANRFRMLQSMVRATKSAVQSLTTATDTALAWDVETFKTDATLHDNVTNNSRLTAAISGKYQVSAGAQFIQNNTGQRRLFIRKNGVTTYASQGVGTLADATNPTDLSVSVIVDLAATDYVEAIGRQDSGGALNIVNVGQSFFSMTYIGE